MPPLSWITLTRSCLFPLLHISAPGIGDFSYQPALLLVALCWSGLELRCDLFTLSLTSVDLIWLSCCVRKKAVAVLSNLSGAEEKVASVHLVIHKSGFSSCSGAPGFQFRRIWFRIWLNRNLFISFILAIQCNHNCYCEEQRHMTVTVRNSGIWLTVRNSGIWLTVRNSGIWLLLWGTVAYDCYCEEHRHMTVTVRNSGMWLLLWRTVAYDCYCEEQWHMTVTVRNSGIWLTVRNTGIWLLLWGTAAYDCYCEEQRHMTVTVRNSGIWLLLWGTVAFDCYCEEQWHMNHSSTDIITKVRSSRMPLTVKSCVNRLF